MACKRALGAFPFLPFLSQTAVTNGRLSRQNHSLTREDCKKKKKEKKGKRRWKSYSTAGGSGWEKETKGDGLAAVWNMTPEQGESI